MPLPTRFTARQLETIIDEAAIYLCACPAQVCEQLLKLRALYDYQSACLEKPTNADVHETIAAATAQAHALLEECLDQVLAKEGWDRESLKMPQGLRELRDSAL